MTNTGQNRPRRALTRTLLILPLGLALSAVARAQTAVTAPSCSVALDALISEWRSIGFTEPGKPTQMIVAGRHGYTTTAGQFNFMRREISAGARECEAGHDGVALQQINTVRASLEHAHTT